jgi:zinc transporter 2
MKYSAIEKEVDLSPEVECESPRDDNLKRLKLAVTICAIFFIIELVGGLYTGSLALLSDSTHLLTDCLSYAVSIFAISIAKKKATSRFSLGFARAEILGALLSILLIWTCTAGLVVTAIRKLSSPETQQPINSRVMLGLALVALFVNVMYVFPVSNPRLLTLLQHDHHHHQHEKDDVESSSETHAGSINMRAAIIHALGDLICSGGVLLASIIIMFKPEWVFVDALCSFLFAIVIICTTYPVARDIFIVLMQGTPLSIDRAALRY